MTDPGSSCIPPHRCCCLLLLPPPAAATCAQRWQLNSKLVLEESWFKAIDFMYRLNCVILSLRPPRGLVDVGTRLSLPRVRVRFPRIMLSCARKFACAHGAPQ